MTRLYPFCLGRRSLLIFFVVLCIAGMVAPARAQFETRASVSTAENANYAPSVVVGDFNRDGKLDLAMVGPVEGSSPVGNVTIMLGNGDGTFTSGASYAEGVQPEYATAASLRNNRILDLVVGDSLSDYVYVMLGNGDGTFQPPVAYRTAGRPESVSAGDFNGDGKADIIALTGNGAACNCVEVLLGNGDGTLGAPVTTHVPYDIGGYAMGTGDFNNDGELDVAVAGSFVSANKVDILLGNGDGSFRPDGYYPVGLAPNSVATGHFSGEKATDLAVANLLGGSISVLLGNGNGSFRQAVDYDTWAPVWVAVGDLNGDGKEDLAVANYGSATTFSSSVTVFTGNGDGTFRAGALYPVGLGLSYVAIGDFNGDGWPDLVAVDSTGQAVITLLNTGTVSFSPTTPITFPTQLIGTASEVQSATLTNNGISPLTISSIAYSGEPFHLQTDCKGIIAPGGDCTLSATFKTETIGASWGTVTLSDSASSKPQVVELLGTATEVKLNPAQLTFGPQKLDTQSPPRYVRVTNVGIEPFEFTRSIYVGGTDGFDFSEDDNCPTTLNSGASCAIKINFRPRIAGSCSASLTINDTGGGSPQLLSITGTATN